MIQHPNCKINIGLHVTSKRLDGFHNIETIFYPISLCDDLMIESAEKFSFTQDGIPIDGDIKDNLCVKAYSLLKQDFPNQVGSMHIHLTKNIPFGAGLGGGSSDAAFTLKMVNELCHLNLSVADLENYARRLGADCAFFIRNQVMYAHDRGDVFEPINLDLSDYKIVLLKPSCGVSTAEAYRGLQPKSGEIDLRLIETRDISTWKDIVVNHFETSIFKLYPQIARLKDFLYSQGAIYASMSGSGSTVYGFFKPDTQVDLKSIPEDTMSYVLSNKQILV